MAKPVMKVINSEDGDFNQYLVADVTTDSVRVNITPDEFLSPIVSSLGDAIVLMGYYENVAQELGFDFVVDKSASDLISELEEELKENA